MLVVSRKAGESIIIDGRITVKIVSSGSDKVTVGIDAPREVSIVRSELYETIEENKAAQAAADLSGSQAENLAAMLKSKKSVLGKASPGIKTSNHKMISPKD